MTNIIFIFYFGLFFTLSHPYKNKKIKIKKKIDSKKTEKDDKMDIGKFYFSLSSQIFTNENLF